ncbi:MAG: FAD:protein FMN transferase [Steroidobacteraceae bacterium]
MQSRSPHAERTLRRARPLLGTLVEVRVTSTLESGLLHTAIDAAFAAIERVQRRMSFHDDRSDVSRINAAPAGEVIGIHADTYEVLSAARTLGDLCAGAFDIATAASLVRNQFLPQPGSRVAARAPEPDATYRDLELLPDAQVRWRRAGWIDLGGIAKGYAVDRAIDELRAHGVANAVVNAGGDLRCLGEAQPIHVRAPDEPAALVYLGTLQNASIATSAGYFCGLQIDNGRIDALVDPDRGTCIAWERSISVLAADCMTADALTKVVRLVPQSVLGVLQCLNAQAVVIDRNGLRACGREWLRPPSAGSGAIVLEFGSGRTATR